MEREFDLYQQVKKYFERLGYPSNTIVPDYPIFNDRRIDVIVKTNEEVLIAVELKRKIFIDTSSREEIAYHPVTRELQKYAEELGAKYYVVSDGRQHVWMQTGLNGRPEKTDERRFSIFDGQINSNTEFVKRIINSVFEFIRKFPLTGDTLFDSSIILYCRLVQEIDRTDIIPKEIAEIFGEYRLREAMAESYSVTQTALEAIARLREVSLINNNYIVLDFIDEYFKSYRSEWNVPRWLANFMVKLLQVDTLTSVCDMFTRNGVLTSSAYLNHYENIVSYYSSKNELYWIKAQQLLTSQQEGNLRFEPSLAREEFAYLPENSYRGILMAPPFNVKFDHGPNTFLGRQGVKDGNSLFLESAYNSLTQGGRFVAIVPDGFLLSSQYVKAKNFLSTNATIDAIISLPTATFKPYATVKASLLVLEKKLPSKDTVTFFASIEDVLLNLKKSNNSIAVNEILDNYDAFKAGESITPSKNGLIAHNLDVENFHFSRYWFEIETSSNAANLSSNYSSIPLKQLVINITRGAQLVNDTENGNLPFISPASIRSLSIIQEGLSYTSTEKLPPGKIRKAELNDVIVNIIGPYRGKAALVTEEVLGLALNRHLIAIQPDTSLIIPGYLAIALNSKYVQEQFLDKSSASVIQSLNLKSFEEVYLPVPSIEKQVEIYLTYSKLLEELSEKKKRQAVIEGELTKKLDELGKEGGEL